MCSSDLAVRQLPARQVADLRAFAEKEGIDVVGEYEEHGSGAREDFDGMFRFEKVMKRV